MLKNNKGWHKTFNVLNTTQTLLLEIGQGYSI